MDASGGDVHQLTFDGDNYGPHYSPDGHRIAFTHFGSATSSIAVMHLDGSDTLS
jgi:Tol biopolymer transport system component